MRKHLFITGPSGCGKSTLLRRELGAAAGYAGGFVTERRTDADGRVLGYELLAAASVCGADGYDSYRFLDYTVTPPVRDNEVFRGPGVRLLEESAFYPFALIDEFGGFEIVIPQFRNALAEVLNSDLPLIGVLKGRANAAELRRHFGLGDKYTALTENLRHALEADGDTLLLTMEGPGDEAVARAVREWKEEYAHV